MRKVDLHKLTKRYFRVLNSYKQLLIDSPDLLPHTTKPMYVRELAKRLNLEYETERVELIFKTTVQCLCMHLPENDIQLLAGKLPRGMINWTYRNDNRDTSRGLHSFLSTLKQSCGFSSMEEAFRAAMEVFATLGRAISLPEMAKALPEDLREFILQVKEQ